MWPPEHFSQPFSVVVRAYLLGTTNGRLAIAASVLSVGIAVVWQPVVALAPLFLFLLFVIWPPARTGDAVGSIVRWLLVGILFLAPALLGP